MTITRKGRWVVTRRDNGQFVSQHDTVDNAIESAYARTFPTNIAPPRYEVVPPETGTATPASAVYWLIDKDPATQEAPQDFDLMPSFNVRAPIRGKVSAVVGATGQANPQLAVPSWSGPPTYNIDQGTIYTNQTIPVYANGKPITVAWVSGIVGGQTVGPPGPNWITFSAASATPTVTFSGHVDADDVTNMVWSATVGNGTPVINPTAGQITVRQSAPVWVGVPTATAIVGQTVDTNVTQVTVVNSAPVTLAWVSGRINGLPVSRPPWLSFVAGYPPIIRCTNPPNENQDITDMVLVATANGQSVNSSAGSIAVNATDVSWTGTEDDAAVSFVHGVADIYDLTQHVTNWDADLYTMSVTARAAELSAAGISMSSAGVLSYNGTSGTNIIGGVQVTIADNAEADWQTRISDPNVVWYHDFRSDAEVNQFRWSSGFSSGNDPLALGSDANLVRRITSDPSFPSGVLECVYPTTTGGPNSVRWHRPLNPFYAPGNGRSSNDPGAGISLATWAPTSGGNQTSTWPSGYWGPSGVGSATKDGQEFYLQIRVKMDPRRIQGGNTSIIVGKFVWFNTTHTSFCKGEHVTYSYGYPNGTAPFNEARNYFRIYVFTGGGTQAIVDGFDLQPGGLSAPFYYSGGWDTLLYQIRLGSPGVSSGSNSSRIIVSGANPGETSYRQFFNHEFAITEYEAQGGLNALHLSAYNNNSTASVEFYHRYAQVIFSKASIPIPNDPVQRGVA